LGSRIQELKKRIKSFRQKPVYNLIKTNPVQSFKRRIQKEREALAKEGKGVRNIAFLLSLISMTLALSFIPFFPQPLPVLVAVLIAFGVYMYPAVGMSLGAVPVVLGLLYHLSIVDFIAMLGGTEVRVFFVALLFFFFIALPVRFRRYEDSIGINLGIIAAMLLFFNATYFLALPLLLTVAILFKKTQSGLAVSYYLLISVPLMLLQYFQHILTVTRFDFWNDPTTVPPIYVSLSEVFSNMQSAMFQFRMFDVSIVLGKIPWNIVETPPTMVHTVGQAVTQYLDSLPGMMLFVGLAAGLVWAVSLFLPSLVNKSSVMRAETLFPAVTSAGVTALFFLFMAGLQKPLAFSAQINSLGMIIGVISSFVFAVPAAMFNFAPKRKAIIEKNSQIILVKAGSLMSKLKSFEGLLNKVSETVPVDVSTPQTNLKIIEDKLNDILNKATERNFKVPETIEVIKELDGDLSSRVDLLLPELNTILQHYQLNLNYAYTSWLKKLGEIGYEVKEPIKISYQKETPPEERVEYINAVLVSSRLLATELCQLGQRVYSTIRSLYDPSLPIESRTITYSMMKLHEKSAPWTACDALIIVFKNWKRQYSLEISKSVKAIQESLDYFVSMSSRKNLQSVLGSNYEKIENDIEKSKAVITPLSQKKVSILTIVVVKNAADSLLDLAKNVFLVLHEQLKTKEKSIEALQPIGDSFWEKNVTLGEQVADAIDQLSDQEKFNLNQMLKSLPRVISLIDPCLWTITQYNAKNEFLLNYPLAKTAIEDLLTKKNHVSIEDLPFDSQEAEQYLKLFFNERNRDFTFDENNLLIQRKT
jgi:hypothetical protein